MKLYALVVVALGLAVSLDATFVGADEQPKRKLADFAGTWEGQSKSQKIIKVNLSLNDAGKGIIRYTVVKGGDGGNDRSANEGAILKEKDGTFFVEFEKTTWSVKMGKDDATLTVAQGKGEETISLTKTKGK